MSTASVIQQGALGLVREGNVDTKWFVLRQDSLDYYASREDSVQGGERGGRLLLDDIEELDVLDNGIRLGLSGERNLELRATSEQDLKSWVDALSPFFQDGSENEEEEEEQEQEQEGEEEIEEEVLHDSLLVVELKGQRKQKYFWLFHDRLEYTNTEDDQVPQESFPLHAITAANITATGFEVMSGKVNLALLCEKDLGQQWVDELKKAWSAHAEARRKKAAQSSGGKPSRDKGKAAKAVVAPNEAAKATGKLVNATPVPLQPPNASIEAAPPMNSLFGYPQTGSAGSTGPTPAAPRSVSPMSPGQNKRPPLLCQGTLGIFQKGREDKRYFALFDDTFEYWSSQADYENAVKPRGSVRVATVVNLEGTSTGFTIHFESSNKLDLRCETELDRDMWLKLWSGILKKNTPNANSSRSGRAEPPPPATQAPSPASQSSRLNPLSPSRPEQKAELPGLIFQGNIMVDNNGRPRKRHFVLFDNRLDYFGAASDMAAERYPRGRILLRDVKTVDFKSNGFHLIFLSDLDYPTMILFVEPGELQSWDKAWTKAGVPRWDGQSPLRSGSPLFGGSDRQNQMQDPQETWKFQSQAAVTPGSVLEGQLGLLRGSNSGNMEARYFVLFRDRFDCFIDESSAKRGRVLESVLKSDIQDIDVVDGGFNIISASRPGRPLKLRAHPNSVPTGQQWIDAFTQAFSG